MRTTKEIDADVKVLVAEIKAAMSRIAKRKQGQRRLVYDKATRSIVSVDRRGNKTPSGLRIGPDEADCFAR